MLHGFQITNRLLTFAKNHIKRWSLYIYRFHLFVLETGWCHTSKLVALVPCVLIDRALRLIHLQIITCLLCVNRNISWPCDLRSIILLRLTICKLQNKKHPHSGALFNHYIFTLCPFPLSGKIPKLTRITSPGRTIMFRLMFPYGSRISMRTDLLIKFFTKTQSDSTIYAILIFIL